MINVRFAALDDVQTILELYAMPHVAPFMRMPNADQVASKLNSIDALSLLLENDGVVFAHALVKDVGTNWRIAEFSQLLVRTQRRGFGRYFMQWVQHFVFKKRNAHRIYLETVAHNEPMRALAQASGFIRKAFSAMAFRRTTAAMPIYARTGCLQVNSISPRPKVC